MHIPAVRLGLRACTTRHRSPRRSWWGGGGNWGATPVPLGFLGATLVPLGFLGATPVLLRMIGATLVPHWGASTGWRRARGLSPAFFQPTGALRWRRQCLGCPLLARRAGAPLAARTGGQCSPRVGLASYVLAIGALLHHGTPMRPSSRVPLSCVKETSLNIEVRVKAIQGLLISIESTL